jgi:apolipoprotein N-acyltransferase
LPIGWPSAPEAGADQRPGGDARREALVRALVIVTSGVALALAFPRPGWSGLAWVALAPILVVALPRPPRIAFGWAWLGATVFFLVLLRWLDFTFRVYSAIPWPLTWFPTGLLAAYCGLWPAAVAGAAAGLARRRSPALALAVIPFLWIAAEWGRGHLMGGFPWGSLGYSQYRTLPVIQVAELGGVYAVSFLLAAVNAALAGLGILPRRQALVGAGLGGVLLVACLAFGVHRLRQPAPVASAGIAVIQPSIDQPLKWDPDHAQSVLRTYLELTGQAAAAGPSLIVWPETAAPTVLRRDPGLVAVLADLAATSGSALLVGSIDADGSTPPGYRNTAFLLSGRGLEDRYDKIKLVPFGEYVPLSGVIGFVRSWAEFIADLVPGSRATVFPGPPAPFGVVICYEGIFPELYREFVRGGARLMVNMTNDAWFGRTSGPWQHLAMYPLRAVEHRTAVVRSANTGISAFVAPSGAIVERLDLYARGTLVDRVPLRSGETVYTRFGDWLPYLGLAVSGLTLATTAVSRRA